MLPNTIARIIEFVQLFTVDCSESNNFDHIMRVHDTALQIATVDTRAVNINVVKAAALMHTLNTNKYYVTYDEHLISKKLIEFGTTTDMAEQVESIVKYIPKSYKKLFGHTITYKAFFHMYEAQIVQDAVYINTLGTLGIIHAITYKTKNNLQMQSILQYFNNKLYKIPDAMKTIQGKKIALERVQTIKWFEEVYRNETR